MRSRPFRDRRRTITTDCSPAARVTDTRRARHASTARARTARATFDGHGRAPRVRQDERSARADVDVAHEQRIHVRAQDSRYIEALAAREREAPLVPGTRDRLARQSALEQWAFEVRAETLRREHALAG